MSSVKDRRYTRLDMDEDAASRPLTDDHGWTVDKVKLVSPEHRRVGQSTKLNLCHQNTAGLDSRQTGLTLYLQSGQWTNWVNLVTPVSNIH
ncbi:hypothetical protein Btru_013207 [Bulinus truncatus]|nr:hypothetical protein Btru_013207 [Bulinus truncatus]